MLEAQVLLANLLQKSRSWIAAHPETPILPEQQLELDSLLRRRLAGEPLPYLIGHWEFYGLDFQITPEVLIPRPETELLVEEALRWLQANPSRRRVADVGTGSGCIAVSLTTRFSDLTVIASDLSWAALRVTRTNAERYSVQRRIHLLQSNLLQAVKGPLDLVCANLPYIPTDTAKELPISLYEPLLAIDGGPDGLVFIHALLEDSRRLLSPGGMTLLEIEAHQGYTVPFLSKTFFPHASITSLKDISGNDRLVKIET